MVKRFIVVSLNVLLSIHIYSQKIITVEGEYIYNSPENVTLEEAKLIALDRAKIQALADEFGTVVSQNNSTIVENSNGKSYIDFLSIGGSEVKGEWLETIGEPEYNITFEQNMLVVKVYVRGKAREILSAATDFHARVLRNGTDDKYESSDFKDGDDLYVSFISPVRGYVAIYLIDSDKQAYCLLPYSNQMNGIYEIVANQRYVFFDTKSVPFHEQPYIDEYTMTCARSSEQNFIYVIFSTQEFTKAADKKSEEGLPRTLSFSDFQRWLVKCRNADNCMSLVQYPIKISK